jgi:glycosyltransferase involved in cell wall biosynthesis
MINDSNIKTSSIEAKPLVSIACPTYNHENFISDAIDGFIMQKTSFTFEIIISDDSSSDGSLKIIEAYRERYPHLIKVLRNSKNRGAVKNWIKVIKSCKGKYIALCDGDDYWTDEFKLQKQVSTLENDEALSGVYHFARVVDEDGKQKELFPKKGKHFKNIDEFLISRYQIPSNSVMFCNCIDSAFDSLFKGNKYIADFQVDAFISAHGEYAFMDDVMSCYRVIRNGNSFTSKSLEETRKDILLSRKNVDYYLEYRHRKSINKSIEILQVLFLLQTVKEKELNIDLSYFFSLKIRKKIDFFATLFKILIRRLIG